MQEEVYTRSGSMTEDVSDLIDDYLALAKANITQKAADAASMSVAGVLMVVLALLVLLFAGLALAWWIGELLNNRAVGFLIVAGLFALFLTFLIIFKKDFLYPIIRNKVVKKAYE